MPSSPRLPILVQAALILFFVGLVDFVWSINHRVVIPVTILIGAGAVILTFLILATIVPTLQIFPLRFPYLQSNEEVPVQCPYKSPQATAFLRLVSSTKIGFTLCAFIFSLVDIYSLSRPSLLPPAREIV